MLNKIKVTERKRETYCFGLVTGFISCNIFVPATFFFLIRFFSAHRFYRQTTTDNHPRTVRNLRVVRLGGYKARELDIFTELQMYELDKNVISKKMRLKIRDVLHTHTKCFIPI